MPLTVIPALVLAFALICGGSAVAQESPADAAARRMGRGVNILGFDGVWEGGVDAPFRFKYFHMLREAGFRHVRINLHAFRHMDDAHRIDPAVLMRLDDVLDRAIGAGLVPVIDEHDFSQCQREPDWCTVRLKAFWTQVSARYAKRFPSAIYEILNEPGGSMTLAQWSALLADTIRIIRRHGPDRTIVAALLNVEAPLAQRIPSLPEADRNIVVTVHYYRPMAFTHQGAPWLPELATRTGVDWGRPADEAKLAADLEEVAGWARAQRRPIYLGEFGVYDSAPIAARARYVASVARNAERLGWPWAYWQFDHDFALFDTTREAWVRPVLDALVPPRRAGRTR
ncbi:MAG TPA: cellulase family glycosylhydrolase [Methylobacterium sp.]